MNTEELDDGLLEMAGDMPPGFPEWLIKNFIWCGDTHSVGCRFLAEYRTNRIICDSKLSWQLTGAKILKDLIADYRARGDNVLTGGRDGVYRA